jgi:hypothetical protein
MLFLVVSPALLGCAPLNSLTPTTGITDNPACAAFKTVTYSSKDDSDITVRQIIANNEARKKLCPSG